MRKWSIDDSAELYNINGWGLNYFSINEKGHVAVTPKTDGPSIDLKELMEELQVRDVEAPVLLRFPDILDNRIEKISNCFQAAAREYGYSAKNFIIYPIKVNQMRPVVEEIVSHGNKFNIGLEAGSKPELHAVLSIDIDDEAMIICNGYKDESYIELALLAQKMGKRIFSVRRVPCAVTGHSRVSRAPLPVSSASSAFSSPAAPWPSPSRYPSSCGHSGAAAYRRDAA